MILLIALRIPAFAFCECQQNVTLNNGACCVEEVSEESDCGCCHMGESLEAIVPCNNDCLHVLSVDPGNFLWSAKAFQAQADDAIDHPVWHQSKVDLLPHGEHTTRKLPIRGSPPTTFLAHLRTQVLRL